jgi:ribokinase
MTLDLLVFGDTAIDNFYEVDRLPKKDDAVDVSSSRRYYGGMGANTAVVANSLGLKVGLCSVIGTDAEDYRNYLDNLGIKLYLKGIFGDTTKSMFFRNDDEQVSFFYKGVTEKLDELNPKKEFGKNLEPSVKTIYMARTYLELQKKAFKQFPKAKSVYNPGYGTFKFESIPTGFKTLMNTSNTLVLNEHELDHLKKIGYKLKPKPTQTVIITRGSQGARVYLKNSRLDIPTYKVKAKDVAGAGDAFNAGLIAGSKMGLDTVESVRFANACASFIVESWGCQTNVPNLDQVIERYEKLR